MKSHASDLLELALCVFRDAWAKCTTDNSPDDRDIKTISSRVKHEGLSFLTITLPALGSELETALATGGIAPTQFRSFRKRGKAPAFLQGFFAQVFDIGTGRILNEPSIESIEGIRQIAYAFKKLEVQCTPEKVRAAFRKFIEDEQAFEEQPAPGDLEYYNQVCRALWDGLLDHEIDLGELIPKHGPGATAEQVSGNQKYCFSRYHDRLEPYFPLMQTAFSSESAYASREFEAITAVPSDGEQPVRVITVPKTLKAPRIIAIEPVCMQFTQQAISGLLVQRLESHKLTSGHINFKRQDVNRRLALDSSIDGRLATLDLSSASDRVPLSLALCMFDGNPDLRDAIYACRSKRAQLPTGEVIDLKKFASMGSALCFPVEAMYFYTICVGALLEKRDLAVTTQNIYKVSRDVYVYGDDILVPTDEVDAVSEHLQKYYCKVNMSKSFWTGRFRESCGMDAYAGQEVTPVYIRRVRPTNRRSAKELISWVKTSNQFYKKGYWLTADHLVKQVEMIIGRLPIVGEESPALGKVSFQRAVTIERWGKRFQRPEVRAWVAEPVYRTDELDGYPALLKSLLNLERRRDTLSRVGRASWPDLLSTVMCEVEIADWRRGLTDSDTALQRLAQVDPKHLLRSARHGAVTLKRRWTSPC